jgi:nucleoside-diphosphate-sugar epimerase
MPRIAVTGASGLVGRHVIPMLLEEGHEVCGLARSPQRREPGGTVEGFDFVEGDVRDAARVRSLVEGCELVIHLASSVRAEDDIPGIITHGARNVLDAARAVGVKRLVYMSCLGTDAASTSPFYRAKWEAETLLKGSGVPYTILRPSMILGRGMLRPLAHLIRLWPVVPVPGRGDARLQPVDVGDAARCVTLALGNERLENETFSVGGPMYVTIRQMLDLIAGELGVSKPKALVPLRMLPSIAAAIPGPARAFYTFPRVDQLGQGVVASPGIIDRTFGFQPSSILPGIAGYIA